MTLTVHDYVKTATKKTLGLKAIAAQLGTLFNAMKAKPAKAVEDAAIEPLKQAS